MAVVIRMKRTGRRNRPCYRISVSERRVPRDGRTLECIGLYDPIQDREELRLELDVERARHWLAVGAIPSDTVKSIFKRRGVYEGELAPGAKRKARDRKGRRKVTAKRTRKLQEKSSRAELKLGRQKARAEEKKAAKAAAGSSDE